MGTGVLAAETSAVCGPSVKPERIPNASGTGPRVADAACPAFNVLAAEAGGFGLDQQTGRRGAGWALF
jgi:hypothetical protein